MTLKNIYDILQRVIQSVIFLRLKSFYRTNKVRNSESSGAEIGEFIFLEVFS